MTSERPPHSNARSVRRRVVDLAIALSSLMLIVTATSLYGLVSIRDEADANISVVGPVVDANNAIRRDMETARSAALGRDALPPDRRDGPEGRAALVPYTSGRPALEEGLAGIERLTSDARYTTDARERARMTALVAEQRTAAHTWWDQVASPGRAATPAAQSAYARFETANAEIDRIAAAHRQQLRESMRDKASTTGWGVVVATVVAALLSLLLSRQAALSLTRPIVSLRDTMRRQRLGDSTALADELRGPSEIRDLAVDVNALTREYNRLMAEQAYDVRAQAAETGVTRAIREAPDLISAMEDTVAGLARAVDLPRVACALVEENVGIARFALATRDADGEEHVRTIALPESTAHMLGRIVTDVWNRQGTVVVQPDPGDGHWATALLGDTGSAGLVIAPFGRGARAIGIIVAAHDAADRRWRESTITAINHIAAEMGTQVVSGEAERAREEHVRRLEDLDRQKDDFMSTVSHELRTPLTSISGYLEMLEDGDAGVLTRPQRKMLDVVGRNAARLRGLIEDLLVLNRMESTLAPGKGEDVDLTCLVRHTVEELRPVADKGAVTLEVVPGAEDGAEVHGDRGQLGRALTNVISNAVKFTPRGGSVTVSVDRVDATADAPASVEVAVTDTGIGIPTEDQERLFTRFFRASNATSAQVPGTGLGLVIVKGIVERHQGRMSLESTEGVGTTVRLRLPVRS